MQTKKQKREKALAYWEGEIRKDCTENKRIYIKGQIATLRRKLTKRAIDEGDSAALQALSTLEVLSTSESKSIFALRN